MAEKQYKVGLVIGRFQPFHKGHKLLVDTALANCDQVVVVIGSAQAYNSPQNPLAWGERYNILSNVYRNEELSGKLHFLPVHDRDNYSNDASFGEYIDSLMENALGLHFDCVIEGEETVRTEWFNSIPLKGRIQVNRDGLDVSGTKIREAILNDDTDYLDTYGVEEAKPYYYKIKRILKHYAE